MLYNRKKFQLFSLLGKSVLYIRMSLEFVSLISESQWISVIWLTVYFYLNFLWRYYIWRCFLTISLRIWIKKVLEISSNWLIMADMDHEIRKFHFKRICWIKWNFSSYSRQVRGHRISKIDPLGISLADDVPPELTLATHNLGMYTLPFCWDAVVMAAWFEGCAHAPGGWQTSRVCPHSSACRGLRNKTSVVNWFHTVRST